MEVHLFGCYAGAARSHCHPDVHKTPHLLGMERARGSFLLVQVDDPRFIHSIEDDVRFPVGGFKQ